MFYGHWYVVGCFRPLTHHVGSNDFQKDFADTRDEEAVVILRVPSTNTTVAGTRLGGHVQGERKLMPVVQHLNDEEREKLVDALEPVFFEDGSRIIEQVSNHISYTHVDHTS